MSREEQDRKNKRFGMIISTATHVAVLILFIFLVAWRAPNPPHPEIGIELNFGTSDQGSGDQQPEPFTPPADTESEEDAPETEEEIVEDIPEEVVEEETTPVEETTEVVENVETTEVEPVTEQPTEAPVKEPEVKEEKKEEVKEEVKEQPKELPKVLYPGTKDGTSNEAKNANQGDKTDAVGDQGDKEGTVDARSLYGTGGGGGGGEGLDMPGWILNSEPRPDHGAIENGGKIVFDFKVDDKGNVFGVTVKEFTVPRNLVDLYKKALEEVTLSKTSAGAPPAESRGRITFIIKAK